MSIDEIVKKISSTAESKKDEIIKSAHENAQKIQNETEKMKEKIKEDHLNSLEQRKRINQDRVHSKARQEVKRSLETLQRSVLNEIFADALKRLTGLNSKDYQRVLENLLSSVSLTDTATISAPANRVEETKAALQKYSLPFSSIQEISHISGGILIKDQSYEYDFSFESLIHSLQHERETEIASTLFSA